jgi:hypothetical protein
VTGLSDEQKWFGVTFFFIFLAQVVWHTGLIFLSDLEHILCLASYNTNSKIVINIATIIAAVLLH